MLSTASGSEVAGSTTRYLPFGGYRGTAPTQTITDRDFTGQKENRELGLLYYNARFYAPGVGRFLSADTIVPDPMDPQAYNRYSYVRNNPLKYLDANGHCWGFASGIRNNAIAASICNGIDEAVNDVQEWWAYQKIHHNLCTLSVDSNCGFIPNYSPPSVDEVLQQQRLLIAPESAEQLRQFRENFKAVQGGVQTWNQFQSATSGIFSTRADAAAGWEAYKSSNRTDDILIIGSREDTLAVQGWTDHQILDIQGWTIGANDAWVQGGIDRGATFYIASPLTHENLWDDVNNRDKVFARELEQLLAAGYTQQGDYMVPPSP